MQERQRKSFELASDVTKQMITVAVAVVTFVSTVLRSELKAGELSAGITAALLLAIVSVCAGLFALLVMTGTIASKNIADAQLSVYAWLIRGPALLQLFTFVASLILLVLSA